MYSAYGMPYECHIEQMKSWEDNGLVCLSFHGVARRRRDIPTMAEQEKERMDEEMEATIEGSLKVKLCTTRCSSK